MISFYSGVKEMTGFKLLQCALKLNSAFFLRAGSTMVKTTTTEIEFSRSGSCSIRLNVCEDN